MEVKQHATKKKKKTKNKQTNKKNQWITEEIIGIQKNKKTKTKNLDTIENKNMMIQKPM